MDAISYLRSEHNRFRRVLKQISTATNITVKKRKFTAFCADLLRHETMEQKAWYPVLRQYPELRKVIAHLLSEEKSAAKAMKKFKATQFDFMWKLRFTKFKHDVDHHAKEEEKELFPKVRKHLSKKELTALGTKLRKFKAGLK